MTLCAFDLQMSIEKKIEVDNDKPEDMILPAKVFSDIIRKVQGDDIYMETDKDLNVIIRCGRSEFNLKAEPGAGFPEVPYIGHNDGVYLPCSSLRQMITDTMFAISTNENKPVHMGALFEVADNLLTVVSVDGYRLAIRKDDQSSLLSSPGRHSKSLSIFCPTTTSRSGSIPRPSTACSSSTRSS